MSPKDRKNVKKKKLYFWQNIVRSEKKIIPKNNIFYKDNIRVSVTNSMSVHCRLYTLQDHKNRQNQTKEAPHGLYNQWKVCNI